MMGGSFTNKIIHELKHEKSKQGNKKQVNVKDDSNPT